MSRALAGGNLLAQVDMLLGPSRPKMAHRQKLIISRDVKPYKRLVVQEIFCHLEVSGKSDLHWRGFRQWYNTQ